MADYIHAPPGFDLGPDIANASKVIKDYTAILIFEDGRVGSGTFINARGIAGILTAHHVAALVFKSPVFALCIAEHPHSLWVRSENLEHVLLGDSSKNPDPQTGPDLSLIVIRDLHLIGILQSLKSFCYLESQKTAYFDAPLSGSPWAFAGSPHEAYRRISEDPQDGPLTRLTNFVGAGAFHARRNTADFDYIEIIIASGQGDFPGNYQGMSGGGFWLIPMEVDHNENLSTVGHGNPVLAGVAFFQSEPQDGWRIITGHGFTSVYSRVAAALSNRTNK
jgi:hypothetical protein